MNAFASMVGFAVFLSIVLTGAVPTSAQQSDEIMREFVACAFGAAAGADGDEIILKWVKDPIRLYTNLEGDAYDVLKAALDSYSSDLGGAKIVIRTQGEVDVGLVFLENFDLQLKTFAPIFFGQRYNDPSVFRNLIEKANSLAASRTTRSLGVNNQENGVRLISRQIHEFDNRSYEAGLKATRVMSEILFPMSKVGLGPTCNFLDTRLPLRWKQMIKALNIGTQPNQRLQGTAYSKFF